MITLSDAIYRSRSRLNEPAYPTYPNSYPNSPPARFYTDTEITEWVNDALRDIARRAEDLHTYDTSITIPAYTQNPNLPPPTYPLNLGTQTTTQVSDVLRITRVEYWMNSLSNQIYPMEWQPQSYLDQVWNINQISNMSYPTYWTTKGFPGGTGRNAFVMQVYPQPSQSGLLQIYYYRLPNRISDPVETPANYNIQLDLIEGWDDMVVDYVTAQGLIKRQDPSWQTVMQFYETKMENLIDNTRHISDQLTQLTYDGMAMPWQFDGWGGWY